MCVCVCGGPCMCLCVYHIGGNMNIKPGFISVQLLDLFSVAAVASPKTRNEMGMANPPGFLVDLPNWTMKPKKRMARAPALGCGLMALVHSAPRNAPRNVWVSPESRIFPWFSTDFPMIFPFLRPIPRIFPWNPRDSNGQLRVIQLDLGAMIAPTTIEQRKNHQMLLGPNTLRRITSPVFCFQGKKKHFYACLGSMSTVIN